jgi:hypothetical protein
METSKKGRKQGKKENKASKKAEDKSKREHKYDDEAKKKQPVVRQEPKVLESDSRDMIDDMPLNSAIAEHLSQIEQGLHCIHESHLRLHEQIHHMDKSQNEMHDKIQYLIGWQNDHFSCVQNISPIGSTFAFEEEETEEGHHNSRDASKGGDATKELLKRRRALRLPSSSDETEFKPQAKPRLKRRSNDENEKSPKPRKGNSHDQEETEHPYYKQFPPRQCDQPTAVNHHAHAGLKNSNVNCYSNAILQCIASCIRFSDFSPSENHPQFPLNHRFASLMNS